MCSNSGSGNICPVNYECYYDGFVWGCCPTKTYTCTLSSNKGVTCGAGSSHRYYYNSQTQECESFLYNGKISFYKIKPMIYKILWRKNGSLQFQLFAKILICDFGIS